MAKIYQFPNNGYTPPQRQQQVYEEPEAVQEARRWLKNYERDQALAPWIAIAIIVVLVMFCCNQLQPAEDPGLFSYNQYTEDLQFVKDKRTEIASKLVEFHDQWKETYYYVPIVILYMRAVGVRDLNGDGKINCIDYACTFQRLYGRGCFIIQNYNPYTGFNHLFNRIVDSQGRIYDIEPQGTPENYAMKLIWGQRYNPLYNKDVTQDWGQP